MLSSFAEAIAVLAIISIVFHLVGSYRDIAHTHLTSSRFPKMSPISPLPTIRYV